MTDDDACPSGTGVPPSRESVVFHRPFEDVTTSVRSTRSAVDHAIHVQDPLTEPWLRRRSPAAGGRDTQCRDIHSTGGLRDSPPLADRYSSLELSGNNPYQHCPMADNRHTVQRPHPYQSVEHVASGHGDVRFVVSGRGAVIGSGRNPSLVSPPSQRLTSRYHDDVQFDSDSSNDYWEQDCRDVLPSNKKHSKLSLSDCL